MQAVAPRKLADELSEEQLPIRAGRRECECRLLEQERKCEQGSCRIGNAGGKRLLTITTYQLPFLARVGQFSEEIRVRLSFETKGHASFCNQMMVRKDASL